MPLPELSKGRIIGGDFEVERRLGQGDTGTVYLVRQLSNGRKRALKLTPIELGDDPELLRRFERDATIGAELESEHVAEVVAAGIDEESKLAWIAMEYLEGEDLQSRLAGSGALGAEEALGFLRQLCHALGAAHEKKLVHRDLRPEHVFIAKSARADVPTTVKLLGFGLARAVSNTTSHSAPIGAPLYAAPEQLRGRSVTPATDVWALGLLTFELLTGKSYWKSAQPSSNADELPDEIKAGLALPARARARALGAKAPPPGFDAWLAKCCAIFPEQRFANASEAFDALEPILKNADENAKRASPFAADVAETTLVRMKDTLSRDSGGDTPGAGLGPEGSASAGERPAKTQRTWLGPAVIAGGAALLLLLALAGGKLLNEPERPIPATESAPAPPVTYAPVVPKLREVEPSLAGDPSLPPTPKWDPRPMALGPDAGDSGFLTIMCVPGCNAVLVDGKNLGPSPIVRAALPPGTHELVLQHTGKPPKTLSVSIAAGHTTARRVTME